MRSTAQIHLHEELDLFARTGLCIAPIAPALASVLQRLVGAEGCFIGWFDERGVPEGFFHNSAGHCTSDFFEQYEAFLGPDKFNISWIANHKGTTRMMAGLFRTEAQPFSDDDAHRLHALILALQMAVVKRPIDADLTGASC